MKNLKRISVVCALAIVIIFAGCLGSGEKKEPTGVGLYISDFHAPVEVDAGDQFDVDLIVQNIGDQKAENINAELFQTSGIKILTAQTQTEQSLQPPKQETGIGGDEKVFTWLLEAPSVRNTETKSLQARITYDYTSTASSNLYVVSKREFDEKGARSFQTYSESSAGPVALGIIPMPAFKVPPGGTLANVEINFEIENTGSGIVQNSEIRDFTILLKNEPFERDITTNCPDIVGGKLKLYGGDQRRTIKCSFVLLFSQESISYIVEASIKYTYYFDTYPIVLDVKKSAFTATSVTINVPSQVTCKVKKDCKIYWELIGDLAALRINFCGSQQDSALQGKGVVSSSVKVFNEPTTCFYTMTVGTSTGDTKTSRTEVVVTN